jgi:hypothetical protein
MNIRIRGRLMLAAAALVWAGWLAGCAGSAAPSSGRDASRARPAAWQQSCAQVWSVQEADALAASRGMEGWELVALYNGVMCFKRPLPGGSAPAPGPRPPSSVPAVQDPGF